MGLPGLVEGPALRPTPDSFVAALTISGALYGLSCPRMFLIGSSECWLSREMRLTCRFRVVIT